MADTVSTEQPLRMATNLKCFVIGGRGVLTALAVLAVGVGLFAGLWW
jgi:hypothetical protein